MDYHPIQHLYNPMQRWKYFPRVTWDFQIRAARNLAAAFEEIHRVGCLVGDVNEKNVQVSAQAIVRLIDCDSFQIHYNGKIYPCDVGVALYTPPELQHQSLRGINRTVNHDRFGLAVLIYQLLFVGKHPYAGLYQGPGDPTLEDLIAQFRFAQGPAAHTWGMAPPPFTPLFSDIPPDLGNLFRRAFERGSERDGHRPAPDEWIKELERLEASLATCRVRQGHRYWIGARSCTWCRLEREGGPDFYHTVSAYILNLTEDESRLAREGGLDLDHLDHADAWTFVVDEQRLQTILRRVKHCLEVDFPYDRRRFAPKRPPQPKPLPDRIREHSSMIFVLSVATTLCIIACPLGLIHQAIGITGFLGSLVFGCWLAICRWLSPWHQEWRSRKQARDQARHILEQLENEWRVTVRTFQDTSNQLCRSIEDLIARCRGLAGQYQAELRQITAQAENAARLRHMRMHLIVDAQIPLIGQARKRMLADEGILTAADIDYHRIRGISGFGEVMTRNLLDWKEEVLRQFRFDPNTAVSLGERRNLFLKFARAQQDILAKLEKRVQQMESLISDCQNELNLLVPQIQQAVAQYIQAEANFNLMVTK
jgi:DNA-binding helix-hairpin-helix protein with protein kinase domain